MSATEVLVWEQVKAQMPVHSCGQRMEPGGDYATGPVLVCTNCSWFEAVDQEWVDDQVNQARAAVQAARS